MNCFGNIFVIRKSSLSLNRRKPAKKHLFLNREITKIRDNFTDINSIKQIEVDGKTILVVSIDSNELYCDATSLCLPLCVYSHDIGVSSTTLSELPGNQYKIDILESSSKAFLFPTPTLPSHCSFTGNPSGIVTESWKRFEFYLWLTFDFGALNTTSLAARWDNVENCLERWFIWTASYKK